jgi:protein-disulfide isomerase
MRTALSKVIFVFTLLGIMTVGFYPDAGAQTLFPTYGTGAIQVRLYTDYFCPPCRGMEPAIEPLLRNLIDKKVIQLTLIDTPFNPHSPLYARYYLYAWKAKSDFEHALMARNALFGAAAGNLVTTDREIEKLFKGRGITYAAFDTKQIFKRYNDLIKEDKINQTPSCVIISKGKKETFIGGAGIVNALKGLR